MNNIIFKPLFKKGARGKTGDIGINYEVPEGAIIAYDGVTTPEGYEEIPVEGTYIEKTINGLGTYNAADFGADGFSKVTVNLTPNYNWYYNAAKTLVVREKISDGSFRWYFDNFHVTSKTATPVPSNLSRFIKNNCAVTCNESHPDSTSSDGYAIGFTSNTIRVWTLPNGNYNDTGYFSGILESTMGTGFNPMQPWVDPTFDPVNG